MPVSIIIDIAKTVVGANQYDVAFTVTSSMNIDQNIFVLDFPGLKFHQVANPYTMLSYPVYDPGNPPPVGTKYVRKGTATLSFPDPTQADSAIATVKSDLKALCVDWNEYNTNFSGNEEFTATSP